MTIGKFARAQSTSTATSKARESERIQKDIAGRQKRRAELEKRAADKTAELGRLDQQLRKEQDREQKRFRDQLERRERERQQRERSAVTRTLSPVAIHAPLGSSRPIVGRDEPAYDAFISHASEDKEEFVRPLAEALTVAGLRVWYDEFELKVGDSLRRSIDKGLSRSQFGIVVLSPAFFEKNWTQYELDGLVSKEMAGEGKVILPIWHRVSKDDVMKYSPALADRVALRTADYTLQEIAVELAGAIRTE